MIIPDARKGKKLEAPLDKEFPFMINDTYGIHKSSTMLHWQECIEICYIKQGTGTYLIGGREYPFERGDVFIINSREIHVAYNDKDVIIQVTLFDPRLLWSGTGFSFEASCLSPFANAGINFENKLENTRELYNDIVNLLLEIEHEFNDKKAGYKNMIKSQLLKLSTLLARYWDKESEWKISERTKYNDSLNRVYDYIDKNFSSDIKLKELADIANMSVSNFCSIFKKISGVTVMEYLNRIRVVKASHALLESDNKIVDIAMNSGYSSVSYFIKSFKKYTGKVPSEFRKMRK